MKVKLDTVKDLLDEDIRELKTGNRVHKVPLPHWYNLELYVMEEFDAEHMLRFQKLIGILLGHRDPPNWYPNGGKLFIKIPGITTWSSYGNLILDIPLSVE